MVQRNYIHDAPVNDVVIHPNQGELISCDQSGSVKIWDLGENTCTHELVPDEEVAIRSVSIASDGGMLVAGNDLVSLCLGLVHDIRATSRKREEWN
jgi:G protein beta subunit-like protein